MSAWIPVVINTNEYNCYSSTLFVSENNLPHGVDQTDLI